jgi:hypothetical protein
MPCGNMFAAFKQSVTSFCICGLRMNLGVKRGIYLHSANKLIFAIVKSCVV